MWTHKIFDLQMTSEVTCDLEDDPQGLVMQISHVRYQNDELNETNSSKECLASHMITADLQVLGGH